ncbi:hypothetical protein PSYJA_33060, partial [Pseudomonas syringae pv. japonica str. M301072]
FVTVQFGKPYKEQRRLPDVGLVSCQCREARFPIAVLNSDNAPDL